MGVLSAEKLAELRASNPSERGNRLDLAIRLSKLPQGLIAKSIQVTPGFLSRLKLGRRRRISTDTANKVAAFFGCEATDLFPSEDLIRTLATMRDLPRALARPRSSSAGTKRPKRRQRKLTEFVYPLPARLEKQRQALFEMLTDARLASGFTLQEIADQLDRTRQQVEQWESAVRNVRIDTFIEWADALGFRVCLERSQRVAERDATAGPLREP